MTPREAAKKAICEFKEFINGMSIDDKLLAVEEFVQEMDQLEEEIRFEDEL